MIFECNDTYGSSTKNDESNLSETNNSLNNSNKVDNSNNNLALKEKEEDFTLNKAKKKENNEDLGSDYEGFNTELLQIDLEKLKKHLTCSLCDGIFRTPFTINECMHTFCKGCLYKEFYHNPTKTNCPKCNIQLGGKPLDSFIFDSSLHELINIIFPEFEIIDKENIEKMYEKFRSLGTPLPGDPTLDKKVKPTINISVLPHKHENSNQLLPRLNKCKIQVAPYMDILKFKKYLTLKLQEIDQNINENELIIYYKNIEMNDCYNFINIEKLYSFPTSKADKIVFTYARKLKV